MGTLDICGDTAFPQATCIGQHKTEAVLIRLLTEEQSQEIHWRTELQDYRQHEDYVEAEVRGPDNEVKVVKARYIVGADGTHSVVRKRGSDWTYEGYAVATKFALVDAVVEGPDAEKIRNQRGNFFYTPKGTVKISKTPLQRKERVCACMCVRILNSFCRRSWYYPPWAGRAKWSILSSHCCKPRTVRRGQESKGGPQRVNARFCEGN